MIKFYLITVLIYFVFYMISKLVMHKQYKMIDYKRKTANTVDYICEIIDEITFALLMPFVPILRLIIIISIYCDIFWLNKAIKLMKEIDDK